MLDSTTFQEPPKSVAVSGKGDRLLTSGFVSLLSVSFLEAANDNLLKQILMFIGRSSDSELERRAFTLRNTQANNRSLLKVGASQ